MSESTVKTFVMVVTLFICVLGSGTSHAVSIIDSGDLLTVSGTGALRSYTFDGTPQQTLAINLSPALKPTGTVQGVAVVDGRLFVGLVSTVGATNPLGFAPKILEVDPTSGEVLHVLATATPQITALGDDGTNLLLLDSVNTWDVYTYGTDGTLLTKVAMDRHVNFNFQGEGIDGDGEFIFWSANLPSQLILINTLDGDPASYFDTHLISNSAFIGGLAYDPNDDTLWVASADKFRQFNQDGDLMATVSPGIGTTTPTGLEVISSSPLVPIPTPAALAASLGGLGLLALRRPRQV